MIDDADDARLYGEVSALAKALSLDRPHPSSSPEPSSLSRYWNPFKLLPRLRRRRRLDCRFSLHVHSITSLPPSLSATALRVHWKHSAAAAHTNPARAICGTAQFDEILTERCSVYGSRSGPHRSAAYEARPFLLYATVESDPYIDLGRHRVDLARLLPVSLEEQSSGEWSTSFRLSGKATGASLNVSFGFSLAVDSSSRRKVKSSNQQRSGRCEGPDQLQRSWSCFRGQSIDVSDSLLEYSELKIDSQSSVEVSGELSPELKHCMDEGDEPDYVVIDKGIELEDGCMKLDSALPELETVFSSLSVRHEDGPTVMSRSNSLDDLTETVASEFLSMLESEANSGVRAMEPQYRSNWRELSVVPDHTSNFHDMGMGHSKAGQAEAFIYDWGLNEDDMGMGHSKSGQTEALIHDWGLNEEAFGSSPPKRGFGSPIELPFEGEPKTRGEPKVKDSWSQRQLWRL